MGYFSRIISLNFSKYTIIPPYLLYISFSYLSSPNLSFIVFKMVNCFLNFSTSFSCPLCISANSFIISILVFSLVEFSLKKKIVAFSIFFVHSFSSSNLLKIIRNRAVLSSMASLIPNSSSISSINNCFCSYIFGINTFLDILICEFFSLKFAILLSIS